MKLKSKLADNRGVTLVEVLIMVTLLAVLGTPLIIIGIESVKMNAKSKEKQYVSSYMDFVSKQIELGKYERESTDPYVSGNNYFDNTWTYSPSGVAQSTDKYAALTRHFVKADESQYNMNIKSEILTENARLGSYSSFGYKNYYELTFKTNGTLSFAKKTADNTDNVAESTLFSGIPTNINSFSFVFSDNGFALYSGKSLSGTPLGTANTTANANYYLGFGLNSDTTEVTRNVRIVNQTDRDLDIDLYNVSSLGVSDVKTGSTKPYTKKISVFYDANEKGDMYSASYGAINMQIKYDNNIELHNIQNIKTMLENGTFVTETGYREMLYTITIYKEDEELLTNRVSKMYILH